MRIFGAKMRIEDATTCLPTHHAVESSGLREASVLVFLCRFVRLSCADLRGKELVMRLMMHPDPNVQKQALLCVQKIMLARDKLEFLNAQNEG